MGINETAFVICLKENGFLYQVKIDEKQNIILSAALEHILGLEIKCYLEPLAEIAFEYLDEDEEAGDD